MVGDDIQAPDKEIRINDAVVEFRYRLKDLSCRGSILAKIARAVCVLRDLPSVVVGGDLTLVGLAPLRVGQILNIVANGQHDLIRDKTLVH